jgi:hypothetical protein
MYDVVPAVTYYVMPLGYDSLSCRETCSDNLQIQVNWQQHSRH